MNNILNLIRRKNIKNLEDKTMKDILFSSEKLIKRNLKLKKEKKAMNRVSLKNIKDSIKSSIKNRKKKIFSVILVAVSILTSFGVSVFASNDPLSVINNLSDFVFKLLRALGMIMTGFAIANLGMSLKSHDPSQRSAGLWGLAGGIIILFSKEILDLIIGG